MARHDDELEELQSDPLRLYDRAVAEGEIDDEAMAWHRAATAGVAARWSADDEGLSGRDDR